MTGQLGEEGSHWGEERIRYIYLNGPQRAIRDIIETKNSCKLFMIRNVIVMQIAAYRVIFRSSVRRSHVDGGRVTPFRVLTPWNR
jgi:hypothetical protein